MEVLALFNLLLSSLFVLTREHLQRGLGHFRPAGAAATCTFKGSISNYHHLKKYELNSLTVGMYVWPEQENGDSI